MTKSSPNIDRKKFRAPRIVFWVLFGLVSGLIIAESFVPSGASGNQSNFLSMILSTFLNETMPSKEVTPIGPTSISFSPDTRFVGGEKAVVGTTKLINYQLAFETKEGTVKDGAVKLTFNEFPEENCFSYVHTPLSTEKGAIRVTPLKPGKYSFTLSDNYGLSQSFTLEVVDRLEPEDMVFPSEPIELQIGEAKNIDYSLVSESYSLPETNAEASELVDHYLQRFYDPTLSEWSSSDVSVATIDEYGFVKGVGFGSADIKWKGETVRSVTVSATSLPTPDFTMSLTSEQASVHPLDYDYYNANEKYGIHLNPVFSDNLTHPVHWVSSDPLVAMVSNEHIEYDHTGAPQKVVGGFVSGYRKSGSATITAVSVENPSIFATFEVSCQSVNPSSFTVSASCKGKAMSKTETNELDSGSVISFSGSFQPKNSSNQILRLEVDNPKVGVIGNNNTSAPNIRLADQGEVTVSVHCPYIEDSEIVRFTFKSKAIPYISDADMPGFMNLVRKGIGHFSLFAVDGVLMMLALGFTFFIGKAWGVGANFGIAAISGFTLGGLSELIQAIPALKRGATWTDVLIDTMGFSTGAIAVAIVFLVIALVRYLYRRKKQ